MGGRGGREGGREGEEGKGAPRVEFEGLTCEVFDVWAKRKEEEVGGGEVERGGEFGGFEGGM